MNNNIHNPAEAGPQTIRAYSPHSWDVEADHSRNDVRPGSIKSYPCTQLNLNKAIGDLTQLTAKFDAPFPADCEGNASFDLWLNGFGKSSTAELMVWTDYVYPASIPPWGTESAKVTFDGWEFTAWRRPSHPGGTYIALAAGEKRAAGSLNLLAVLDWLAEKGWLARTDKIAAVEYGFEIANTPKGGRTFHLNNYDLTTK